jgi:hypothetical protein
VESVSPLILKDSDSRKTGGKQESAPVFLLLLSCFCPDKCAQQHVMVLHRSWQCPSDGRSAELPEASLATKIHDVKERGGVASRPDSIRSGNMRNNKGATPKQ